MIFFSSNLFDIELWKFNFHQCQLLCFRNTSLKINPKLRINNAAAVHCCKSIHGNKVEILRTHSCIRREGRSPSLNFTSFSQRLSMRASCFSVSRISSRDTILFITLSTSAGRQRQEGFKSSIPKRCCLQDALLQICDYFPQH